MKRKLLLMLLTISLVACVGLFGACQDTEAKRATFNLIVDGQTFDSVSAKLESDLSLPNAPKKEGYDFDGWYLDEGTWQQPLSKDAISQIVDGETIGVFALYVDHVHEYVESQQQPTCVDNGFTVCICDCGENFIKDEVEPLGHGFLDYVHNYDGTATATCFREGCNATDTIQVGEVEEPSSPTIKLNATSVILGLYETFKIVPTYIFGQTDATFSSDDESIATVAQDGTVTGVGYGEVKIRVACGDDVAICKITVGILLDAPTVIVGGLSEYNDTISVSENHVLELVICVSYMGEIYNDVDAQFVLEDNSIGVFEGNNFYPNALTGTSKTTKLSINATWRGIDVFEAPTLAKEVNLTVKKEVVGQKTVVFVQEGQQTSVLNVEYGDKIDTSKIPTPTGKTGFLPVWTINGEPVDFDTLKVTENLVITLSYVPGEYTVSFKYNYVDPTTGQRPSVPGLTNVTFKYGEEYQLPELEGEHFYQATGWLIEGVLFDSSNLSGSSWTIEKDGVIEAVLQGAKVKYTFVQEGYEDVEIYVEYGATIDISTFPEVQGVADGYVGGWEKSGLVDGAVALKDATFKAVIFEKDFTPAV